MSEQLPSVVIPAALPTEVDKTPFEYGNNLRTAMMYSKSDLVPTQFQGNIGNCMIALDVAFRTHSDPMMVMQNLYIVKGRPSWSAQFIIAVINGSNKFDSFLRFDTKGEGDTLECTAYAMKNGEQIRGTKITMAMAKAEGWLSNQKWKSMPEQMIQYRAATFFGRLYVSDLLAGMQTEDDIIAIEGSATPIKPSPIQRGVTK